ncbi:MAG: ABC transporter substrate-binding protein [Anaerolineae bacterium]
MMVWRRWFASLVLLAALGLVAAGCALPGKSAEPKTLKIGVLPIADVVPMYVAQQEDFFTQEGIQVELVPVAGGTERDALIQSGGLDGQLNEVLTTLLTNAGGNVQVKIVTMARRPFPNQPLFYIVTAPNSGIAGVEGLKGVEIAIGENTVVHYVADRVLQRAGLAGGDIRFTNVPKIPVRFELVMSGQVKAAVLPDPFASLAVLQGAGVAIDDTAYPEVSHSVISFRTDILKDRPNTIKAFLRAYDKAVQAINQNPQKYQDILVQTARVPETLQGRYTLPTYPEGELPSEAQVEDVVQWALEKGLIQKPLRYDQLVDTSFRK